MVIELPDRFETRIPTKNSKSKEMLLVVFVYTGGDYLEGGLVAWLSGASNFFSFFLKKIVYFEQFLY